VAGPVPNYGFKFDTTKEGYVVYEPEMSVVRRMCRMVGVDGLTLHAVANALEREGVLTATGGKHWDVRVIKNCIVDDVSKPHAFEEIGELVAPEVAARLDPEKSYGVSWYNRRQVKTTHVSDGAGGQAVREEGQVHAEAKAPVDSSARAGLGCTSGGLGGGAGRRS
jgi:hypothetical protein